MQFISFANEEVTWSAKLITQPCPACGNLMADTRETSKTGVPYEVLKAAGIRQLHTANDIEVCITCLYEGKFKLECWYCSKEYVFPAEFAIKLRQVTDYDGGEYYTYICNTCALETIDRADLIRMMVSAWSVHTPDPVLSHLNERLYSGR